MENTKATSILSDIMEKLSLVKKDDVKEVEVKEEVNLSEQIKEEEQASQELTELACQEEVKLESIPVAEEEGYKDGIADEKEDKDEDESKDGDWISREEFEAKISELKGLIEEMKMGSDREKLSMQSKIEELSSQPASQPIKHNPSNEQADRTLYSQNRAFSTRDRVMNRIANLK
tara:strand:+ start:1027 stop:1551 length:525 start_codon:yes stop_codon:yes gene_type:complete